MNITNAKIKSYPILKGMYSDDYFPKFLVDKCKDVLVELCIKIEKEQPSTEEELLVLTHAATDKINDLAEEFEDHDSEIETGARETLAENFDFIAKTYGFDVDVEELIGTRDW